MADKNFEWAIYYVYRSNSKNSGGRLRYWMDRLDVHPRRTLKFMGARLYSMVTGKKIPTFVHIPKTGGTYVSSCFPSNGFVTLNHMLLREDLTDQYIPKGLMGTKWKSTSKYVLFSTVRNPLTFFRSYYHHVIGHGQYHNHDHYDFKTAQKGFEYLLQTILDRDDVWPCRKFLYPQLFDQSGRLIVSWINRNENLDNDMKCFAEKIGYPYLPGEKKRVAPVKDLKEYYSESLMEMVREVYTREFEVFGYNTFGTEQTGILYRDVSSLEVYYYYKNDKFHIVRKSIK